VARDLDRGAVGDARPKQIFGPDGANRRRGLHGGQLSPVGVWHRLDIEAASWKRASQNRCQFTDFEDCDFFGTVIDVVFSF